MAGSRDRTCPACSQDLFYRLYHRYKSISRFSNLKLLTLTSKPISKQSARAVRSLCKNLTKLLHRKRYRQAWRGLLAVVECKKTRSGLFYYHLHAIVSGAFVPQALISSDWRQITGFPICDIRAIRRTPKRAIRYVLKYILKGASLQGKDRQNFKETMKGVHYVRSYGQFYAQEYRAGRHVYFPCPHCDAVKAWVILEFCGVVDLVPGEPYEPFEKYDVG